MAPLSSLHCHSLSDFFIPLSGQKVCKKYKKLQALCCRNNEHSQNQCIGIQDQSGTKRRDVLFQIAFTALSFPAIVSVALAENDVVEDFRVYLDDANKFKIMIPQDWRVGAGETNAIKSVTAFYPEEPSSSNVSVVITGLGADFTRLESFGKVDAFAETLVSGLDRSWQRPPGVAAKLIDCKAANGLYYIEYSLQNPGESRRHLFSVLGMANNGWYNRLYTITGQFVEEDAEKYSSKIEKAVSSFRFI
uniref:PsbP C-terminal domain-containing protein n=1 Tax=Davidia involucrata TaxID=16924 RepID=A0A5B7AJV3_DAVIN